MRSRRRSSLLVPVLLCAVAVLVAGPAAASGDADGSDGLSAEVVRLYEEASEATQRYEEGRRAAETQRGRARRLERLLDRERQDVEVLRGEVGRIARAQYRSGGGLPHAVRMLLARNPDELMRGQRAVRQVGLTVDHTVGRSRRAETRLAADEARAASAWQALDRRNGELAGIKREIERKLKKAQGALQGRADASVAAGACRGSVRLDQPRTAFTQPWIPPVETYALSAGFGSGGDRWANRHTGQDFAVDIGTPVRAAGAGRVVKVACGGPFGIEVVVRHAGGYYTQYAHLAAATVDQGERVSVGQWVGQSGTTGNSTGPHLHFEVRLTPQAGSAVDPREWLAERGVRL
ncbi:murein DD-endopeptidase MepM/ murein hydrolase activator NlpD [Streptomyces sp. V3I8]|jgi:murein DD-endopeptidase MepM/ murein hydrolase activator NlpD|uniref:M23 family metallopeptidase n=1 Tax=Streptomyces sp. V3I8 TaxID=3042279 RepID=UPI002782CC30|nr:M23 family metallopeptidase [Streptomyces sp. V3I8]MDQ1037428.1 murein DD-endopeptidase MepM/ murein hydrolase activator NlpD [Streptomyces sp. V3I8]